LFFIASAWHFGREDYKSNLDFGCNQQPIEKIQKVFGHFQCMALGGLVIWIPALIRPDEMCWLLGLIIPVSEAGSEAQQVVLWTQRLSLVLVPIAVFIVVRNFLSGPNNVMHWVPVATVAIGVFTPILLSFTIYFCAWHSVQGLRRLRRKERLTYTQFAWATFPLSVMAVAGIAFIGWFFQDAATALATGEQAPVLQTLFIGLSAIAVPHLLLHELEDSMGDLKGGSWQASNTCLDSPNLQKGTAS
jgi:Brp/Blh family beta-carotene 15,15'-monooxygenase